MAGCGRRCEPEVVGGPAAWARPTRLHGEPLVEGEISMPDKDNASPEVETSVAQAPSAELRAEKALAMAQGLRSLALMLEENPELVDDACYLGSVDVFWFRDAERMAALARIALRYGAKVDKKISESQHNLLLRWGPVGVAALAQREVVCERVVTGTREVVKAVPDPVLLAAVPLVEVTETVEDVEWKCKPLLAATEESAFVKAGA